MQNKMLVLFTCLFLLVTIVTAQQTISDSAVVQLGAHEKYGSVYTAELNKDYNFIVAVRSNNFSLPSVSTTCTLSLIRSGQSLVQNYPMQYSSGFANLTLQFTNFSETGAQSFVVACDDTASTGLASGNIEVTPQGTRNVTGFYFIIILLSYGVMFFAVYKKDIPIGILGSLSLYFLGMHILFYGIDIFKNDLTYVFGIVTLAVGMYASVQIGLEMLQDGSLFN